MKFSFFLLITVSPVLGAEDLGDPVLENLKAKLPAGWSVTRIKDEVIFERLESCRVLMENRINAPMFRETEAARKQRFMEHGKEEKPKLVIRLEADWGPGKIKEAKAKNSKVYKEIEDLRRLMGMEKLKNQFLSSKGEDFLVPKDKADEEKINKFKTEKEKLETRIIKLPDYSTPKNGLYVISKIGVEDEFHTVFPESASREIYDILNQLRDLCLPEERR